MKTSAIILTVIALLLLVFSSCREVKVTTRVNPDGTFTRIITVTGDSTDNFTTDLPFPVDETWKSMFSRDTTDSTKFIQTYVKSFRNSHELNEELKSDTSSYKNLKREISVTKRFRFFFSYLTFKEVYKSANPFTCLDYHEYLTEEDILWFNELKIPLTPADSIRQDEASDKVFKFFQRSVIAEVDSIMRDGIKRLNNPQLNQLDISVYHDSVYKDFEQWNFKQVDEFIVLYSKWSGIEAFTLLNNLEPPLFEDFEKKLATLENVFEIEGYINEVEMPGLITATNSAMLNGNQVRWDFQPLTIIVRDFEMYAESRVINYWAFVVAGIVLLLLVVLLVIKAVR